MSSHVEIRVVSCSRCPAEVAMFLFLISAWFLVDSLVIWVIQSPAGT